MVRKQCVLLRVGHPLGYHPLHVSVPGGCPQYHSHYLPHLSSQTDQNQDGHDIRVGLYRVFSPVVHCSHYIQVRIVRVHPRRHVLLGEHTDRVVLQPRDNQRCCPARFPHRTCHHQLCDIKLLCAVLTEGVYVEQCCSEHEAGSNHHYHPDYRDLHCPEPPYFHHLGSVHLR